MYLIWSIEHTAWWAPNSRGYTRNRDKAGRYSRQEAERITNGANCGCVGDIAPKEAIVPDVGTERPTRKVVFDFDERSLDTLENVRDMLGGEFKTVTVTNPETGETRELVLRLSST